MAHSSALAFSRLHAEICASPLKDRVRKPAEFFGKLDELSRHGAVIKAEVKDQITLPEPSWVSFVKGDEVTIKSWGESEVVSLSGKRRRKEPRPPVSRPARNRRKQ